MAGFEEIREPMLTGTQLLERWPGLLPYELADWIDRSNDVERICSKPDNWDFPRAYLWRKAWEDEDGKTATLCKPCSPNPESRSSFFKPYVPPYTVSGQGERRAYDFTNIVFRLSDVEKYETANPSILRVCLKPEETWAVSSTTAARPTGSRKDNARIQATSQACESVRSDLEREKQIFDSDKANWEPSLLFDNGKTNWTAFLAAVQKNLGSTKYHYATARGEWEKVSDKLKHKGRVREQ